MPKPTKTEAEIRADERERCLAILDAIADDPDFGCDGEQFGAVYGAKRIRVQLGGEPCPDCGGTGVPYPGNKNIRRCETCLAVAYGPEEWTPPIGMCCDPTIAAFLRLELEALMRRP